MGTNYYWMQGFHDEECDPQDEDSPRIHIGKRSAAGAWCWDCGVTLCPGGTQEVHTGGGDRPWPDECPVCGKPWEPLNPWASTAGMELGFAKAPDVPRTGVGSCSSFTWTMMRHRVRLYSMAAQNEPRKCVRNEYGDEFTAAEFLECLSTVTIEFQSASRFS